MFQSQGSGLYSRFLHVWFAIFPKKLLILRHAQAYWSALKFNLGKKCAEHNSIRSVHLICAQTYVKHSCMLARGHTLRVIIQPLGPCFYSLDLLLILPNDPRLSNDFMVVYLLFFFISALLSTNLSQWKGLWSSYEHCMTHYLNISISREGHRV